MRRRPAPLALALVLLLGLVLGAGCITPSIPIPPPDPTQMSFSVAPADGLARFSYQPTSRFADAIVYVFNQDQGVGIIATARPDGGVGPTESFPAVAGDDVLITFDTGDQAVSTCGGVRVGTPSGTEVCGF